MRGVERVRVAAGVLVLGAAVAGSITSPPTDPFTGAGEGVAHAQRLGPLQRLQAARTALGSYDVEGDGTTNAVASLTTLLAERPTAGGAREARFLRAVASADLWLLTARRDRHGVRSRLASAWGVRRAALPSVVHRQLEELRVGPYREAATDALEALDALESDGPVAIPPEHASHTRRQIALLARASAWLAERDDATALLGSLADDPCSTDDVCEPPYVHFGPHGRRAVAAMTHLLRLLAAVERASRQGDPVSTAFLRDCTHFRDVSLSPRDWAASIAASELTSGRPIEADAVIALSRRGVRIGWVPEVRWSPERDPVASALGPAIIGGEHEVRLAIPSAGRLDDLLQTTQAQLGAARRVAVIVEPAVEAHVLSSVLRALDGSSVQPVVLAVALADGTVRGAPIERVSTAGADPPGAPGVQHGRARPCGANGAPPRFGAPCSDQDALGLFVRRGGLTVQHRGHTTSLPRLRVDGRWRFDMDALAALARDASAGRVGLRYMDTADASVVTRAALVAAGADRTLEVIVR